MGLTAEERRSFTAAKLTELDRMGARRMNDYLEPPDAEGAPTRTSEEKASARAKCIGQWANMSVPALRMRVNCLSFGQPVTYATENDYTAAERDRIAWGWKANVGRKAQAEIPAILAAATELEGDLNADLTLAAGTKAALVKAVLKAR